MEIRFAPDALKDLAFWKKSGNKTYSKQNSFINWRYNKTSIIGVGKHEPLKYELTGKWSRRINSERRIIYQIVEENVIEILEIVSLKGHYE